MSEITVSKAFPMTATLLAFQKSVLSAWRGVGIEGRIDQRLKKPGFSSGTEVPEKAEAALPGPQICQMTMGSGAVQTKQTARLTAGVVRRSLKLEDDNGAQKDQRASRGR
jgi:hypothetical protein